MGETADIADAMLIPMYLSQIDWARVYELDTRRYAADYLPMGTADRLSWAQFAESVPAMFRGTLHGSDSDVLVVAKSLTWSDQDVNVYVGSENRPQVRSFLDLTEPAFVAVFAWHIAVAREVSSALGHEVYVTHGFNPQDSSPDAHSVAAKFHTHLHIPDLERRRPVVPAGLSHFDRLAVIEPYSVVLWDALRHFLTARGSRSRWRTAPGFGFISIVTPLDDMLADDLRLLFALLADVHSTYLELVEVFTAGRVEQRTGHERYVPLPPGERDHRLSTFTECAEWLSADSAAVLRYLARNLAPADARDSPGSRRISSARQAWIAKGLSGAVNFVVSAADAFVRIDIAPRVISTSGATKVISTSPTIIRKDRGVATAADQQRMRGFHQTVLAAVTRVQSAPLQQRSKPSTSSSPVPPVSSA
ncbi:hypothetical protein [Micromonospora zhanjiangensis]|uniref:Uncharacterized protein n=1 Tax=Micromonospora zhanjiangensis TaxID=1522057 RepID=A0ABV8KH93_9ACTN